MLEGANTNLQLLTKKRSNEARIQGKDKKGQEKQSDGQTKRKGTKHIEKNCEGKQQRKEEPEEESERTSKGHGRQIREKEPKERVDIFFGMHEDRKAWVYIVSSH